MVRTNLLGGLYVAREAAKVMRIHSFGRIIGIGSMASTLEPIGDSVYAATKAGLDDPHRGAGQGIRRDTGSP